MWEYAIQTFKTDLKYWSYCIPPGYNTQYKFPLEFKDPIIDKHLIEEEKTLKELPPLTKKDSDQSFYSDSSLYEKTNATWSLCNQDNNDINKEEINTNIIQSRTSSINNSKEEIPSIKVRRNIHHIPPIITRHEDTISSKPNAVNMNTPDSFHTAPLTEDNLERQISRNPFETTLFVQNSPVATPQSTNPFEASSLFNEHEELNSYNNTVNAFHSTNPFEYESLPVTPIISNRRSNDLQEEHINKESPHRDNGIRPAIHQLSLSLSRHSLNNLEDKQKSLKKESNHHKLKNPFKRILSRYSSSKEEDNQAEQ
ncbi:uncharacterized protein BX663DRAFT_69303 [Cokeromyces recurvatus]|uniref:uncharacterized protein n=1 Tax=Cokeromyces recurvatus TaxID=90255 RepID=UPI00221F69BB|nr:uncharacterized protein BX663DRAFT_69303 [Cokeromyces recurvatus]KAI7902776.1 hypothetical protein BX663DRAFT_69303 [Cokeromyces recurvatus]